MNTGTAFGAPGDPASWAHAKKQGVGTAWCSGSRVWFTLAEGILTEIFSPTSDRPQTREIQLAFANGKDLFLQEKKDFDHSVERRRPAQGYRIRSSCLGKQIQITKEIICHPVLPAVLARVTVAGDQNFLDTLQCYVICSPHLNDGGENNTGFVVERSGHRLLAAEKERHWLVAGASCGMLRLSCGYAGHSDGYTDLSRNFQMTWEFDRAPKGNIVLTGQLDLSQGREFTLCIAFGQTLEGAAANWLQSLSTDFAELSDEFFSQWEHVARGRTDLAPASGDSGRLYDSSYSLLRAIEDKTYRGAFIASPATPWGEARNDRSGKGGYHLVWTRDMVESSLGLLAAGDTDTPLRALINLAARQREDGSFAQNYQVDGAVFRDNMQLDEIAFPIILAARLFREGLLRNFDSRTMVARAAKCLLLHGPVTREERWEEMGGYSPSTLASIIAAMIGAAGVLRGEDNRGANRVDIVEEYADFLRFHLEEWTVAGEEGANPEAPRHFIRINPASPGDVSLPGSPNRAELKLPDRAPGARESWPAREVIDAGFLQLVRYGILAADDPLVKDSVKVVDAKLKVSTPAGPCFLRYSHDGYGQKPDGGPFDKWGMGGGWPLLAGERAHYELAAGGDYRELIAAMETFAAPNDLLPEQVWPYEDRPEAGLWSGRAVGSATPLLWAHAEYIRLLRSCVDGKVFDLIPEAESRYLKNKTGSKVDYWLPMHPIRFVRPGCVLRICTPRAFRLRSSYDAWDTCQESDSSSSVIDVEYVDLDPPSAGHGVEFTFFWRGKGKQEGRNYKVVAGKESEDL